MSQGEEPAIKSLLLRHVSHNSHSQGQNEDSELLPEVGVNPVGNGVPPSADNSAEFDDILEMVGPVGKYQKRLLYGFILPYISMIPLLILNTVFMLYEPDHNCFVPGRGEDISLEAWKNLTIPREGKLNRHSQCFMYAIQNGSRRSAKPIECQFGWEYDRSDFTMTIPAEFDWVCSRSHYATMAFTAYYVGNLAGNIVLGRAGDKIGRKLVFLIANFLNVFFRGVSLLVPQYFTLYVFLQFIGGMSYPMMYLAPLTILTEICAKEFRSWIYASTWMVWVVGLCALPLVAWISGDWLLIGVITTAPGILIFIFYKYLPESARWLLSVGRMIESGSAIESIARINGRTINNPELFRLLNAVSLKQENSEFTYPEAWDLFRDKIVAKNTFILSAVWSTNSLVYYGVILNTTSMAGNMFFNFFVLSLIELPAGMVARPLVERLGRRWPQVIGLFLCAMGLFLAAVGVTFEGMEFLVIFSVIVSKIAVSITSLILHLQTNEVFPTQLRSTAFGFCGMISSCVVIATPIVVYLNKVHPSAPYLVMGTMSLIGVISSAFLPEPRHSIKVCQKPLKM